MYIFFVSAISMDVVTSNHTGLAILNGAQLTMQKTCATQWPNGSAHNYSSIFGQIYEIFNIWTMIVDLNLYNYCHWLRMSGIKKKKQTRMFWFFFYFSLERGICFSSVQILQEFIFFSSWNEDRRIEMLLVVTFEWNEYFDHFDMYLMVHNGLGQSIQLVVSAEVQWIDKFTPISIATLFCFIGRLSYIHIYICVLLVVSCALSH